MSTETTTAPAETPKAPEPLPMRVREITRNEVTITPTLALIERGVAKGVTYPVILPTKENWETFLEFEGLDSVIELVAAKKRQDGQATLAYVADKKDLWICTYKTKKVKDPVTGVETEEEVLDANKEKIIATATLSLTDLNAISDEVCELLEKGSIRGGVTIKALDAETLILRQELESLVQKAMASPGDTSIMQKAFENTLRIQSNEEMKRKIQESRSKGNKLEDSAE